MRFRAVALLSAAFALTAAACSDSTGPKQAAGTVTVTASGDVSGRIDGYAKFEHPTDVPELFALGFVMHDEVETDTTGYAIISRVMEGLPAKGTYSLVSGDAGDDELSFFLIVEGGTFCEIQSGTLTVTSSSSSALIGSISAVTKCSGSDNETTFTGTFHAIPGEVVLPA
jgi:hypothetical protein